LSRQDEAVLTERWLDTVMKTYEQDIRAKFEPLIQAIVSKVRADISALSWQRTQLKPNYNWLIQRYGNLSGDEYDITDAPNRIGTQLVLSIFTGRQLNSEWRGNRLIAVLGEKM